MKYVRPEFEIIEFEEEILTEGLGAGGPSSGQGGGTDMGDGWDDDIDIA